MGHVERVTLFPSPACPIQGREKGAMIMPHPLFETISPRPLVQRQLLNGNSSTASGGCSPTRAHRSHPKRSRRHLTVPVRRFWKRFASLLKSNMICRQPCRLGLNASSDAPPVAPGRAELLWLVCARCPGLSCCARMPCAHCLLLSSYRNGHPAHRQRGPH